MKKVKLLSIILALVLFITNTMNLFASNPSRTIDLFTGWTFEENDITVLGTPAGEDNDGYYAWPNSTEVVPGGANGSGYALKVYGANLGNGKTETGLKSNTEYELTFWAKTENATGNVFANVGIENYAADQAPVYLNAFTNEWAKYTITFKTGAESTSAKFYTWLFTDNGGSIELFLDDVVLAEKKGQSLLAPGWTFEENDINVLGTPAGEDNDGYYAWPNCTEVVPGGANGSGYALKVYGGNVGNGKTETGLKSNTEYELTFWAKTENATGNVFANVGISNYAANQADIYLNAFTNEWAKYTITFKTGAENTSARFFTSLWTNNNGSIDLFLDNVVLAEKVAQPKEGQSLLAPGWTFEENDITVLGTPAGEDNDGYYAWLNCTEVVSGGANGSGYALKVYGGNVGNGKTETGLKSNTDYELTFWAKTENATGNVFANVGISNYEANQADIYLNAFTNEWAKYTITFKTGADSTMARMFTSLWTDNGGSIELFLDDVVLAEKVAQPKEGQSLLAPGWTFEENDITVLGTPAGEDNDGYYAWPNCTEVVEGGANGSGYALKVYGGNVGNGKTETGLMPNTDYELTFWAKTENAIGNVFANVGIQNYATNQDPVYLNAFTNEWAKYTITFKTGADSTSAQFYTYLFTDNGGSIDLFLDNVVLTEKTEQPKEAQSLFAPGWTFEENDITLLGTPDGEDGDGYYAWPNCTEVVSGGANGSGYALKIYGGNVGNGRIETGLKPNTEYKLTFWARTENAIGNVFANVGISEFATGQADIYLNAFTNEWAKYTITFKTGAESTSARFFTSLWTDNDGTIDLYIDEVELQELTDVSAPKTGNSTRPMFMLVLTLVSGFVAIVCLKRRQEGWYVKKNH